MLICLAAVRCAHDPAGKPVDDLEIATLLRPTEAVGTEDFRLGPDGNLHYSVNLARPLTKEQYLDELKNRGVTVTAEGTSPHNPVQRVTGYRFTAVQEASLHPYTIRYKIAWDAPENSGLGLGYPHPISISARTLNVRLGDEFAKPWKTHLVVPEKSVASRVSPVPLPQDAIVLDVQDRRYSEAPGTKPVAIDTNVLMRRPPKVVFEILKGSMGKGCHVVREDAEQLVLSPGSDRPVWFPRDARSLQITAEPTLFDTPDGIAVWDARHTRYEAPRGGLVQPRTLKNLPQDVYRYSIAIHLDAQSTIREPLSTTPADPRRISESDARDARGDRASGRAAPTARP